MGFFKQSVPQERSSNRNIQELPLLETLEPRLLLDGFSPSLILAGVPVSDGEGGYYLDLEATPLGPDLDDIASYTIDWGDDVIDVLNTADTQLIENHFFEFYGNYTISVTVADTSGDENTATLDVAIAPIPTEVNFLDIGTPVEFLSAGFPDPYFATDDGSGVNPAVDPDAISAFEFGFDFDFFGTTYTEFYINNNGNITLGGSYEDIKPSGQFPLTPNVAMLAPFLADVDTTGDLLGGVYINTGTNPVNDNPYVVIHWDEVGYFDSKVDAKNTFSLYVEDSPAGDVVAYIYWDMNWTTGDLQGVNGFGTDADSGAQIGIDFGDGTTDIKIGSPYDAAGLVDFNNNRFIVFRTSAQSPSADDQDVVTDLNVPYDGFLTGSDPTGQAITFELDPLYPAFDGTVVINDAATGDFTYTPDIGFVGTDWFGFNTIDTDGNYSAITGFVTVTVNAPPVADPWVYSFPQNTDLVDFLIGTDPENDVLTYSVVGGTEVTDGVLVLDPDTGDFTYTPNLNFTGTDSFEFIVNDGRLDSPSSLIEIIVNDAPVAVDATYTTPMNVPLIDAVTVTDTESDVLVFWVSILPTNGDVAMADDGTFEYTPAPDFFGQDSFNFHAHDWFHLNHTDPDGLVTITVNAPPIVDDLEFETTSNTDLVDLLTGSDFEDDPFTFAIDTNPANGAVVIDDANTGDFTYTPGLDFAGIDTFTYTATDAWGTSAPATITMTVNDKPVADDLLGLTVDEDDSLAGNLTAVDPQVPAIQTLVFSVVDDVVNGTLDLANDGTFTYTPSAEYNGADGFTFKVFDGMAFSVVDGIVTIDVTAVNDQPTADDQSVITEDGTVDITLTGTDIPEETADGDLVYAVTQPAVGGSVALVGNVVTFTATPGYSGITTFTFTVTDTGDPAGTPANELTSEVATVDILVPIIMNFDAQNPLTIILTDGSTVTASMKGPGSATLDLVDGFDPPFYFNDISRIVYTGTTSATSVTIKTTGELLIGRIVFNGGSVNRLDGRTVSVVGDIDISGGSIKQLDLKNASDGTLTIGVPFEAGQTTKIKINQASDYNIDSLTPLASVWSLEWLNDDAVADVLAAPSIAKLSTSGSRGNARRGIVAMAGDFQAGLDISGTGLVAKQYALGNVSIAGSLVGVDWDITGPFKSGSIRGGVQNSTITVDLAATSPMLAIGKLKVAGNFENSMLESPGNMGKLTFGAATGSDIFAGVNGAPVGLPDPYTQIYHQGDGTGLHASIGGLNIGGARKAGWYIDGFAESNVAAYSIGSVILRNLSTENASAPGTAFGVAAWQIKNIRNIGRDRADNWAWPSRKQTVFAAETDFTINLAVDDIDSFLKTERVSSDEVGDGGFVYSDIVGVFYRTVGDWVQIGVDFASPILNANNNDELVIVINLNAYSDYNSLLANGDADSDFQLEYYVEQDELLLYHGGGYSNPGYWSQVTFDSFDPIIQTSTDVTGDGVVINIELRAFAGYDYLKFTMVEIYKDVGTTFDLLDQSE